MKANLFSFHVYLRQDGNIELQKESVRPDELQKKWTRECPIMTAHTPSRPFLDTLIQ